MTPPLDTQQFYNIYIYHHSTLNYITYENGGSFVKDYYNGGTSWNTETETLQHPSDGATPAQVLKIDAADVNTYYDFARREPFVWPDEFELRMRFEGGSVLLASGSPGE